MGLFGGDSSSSTSNFEDSSKIQTSSQYGSPVVIKGDSNNIRMIDGGAVRSSYEFANNVSQQAIDFASAANQQAIDFASAANKQITTAGQNMYEGALATVSDQNKLLADAYQQGQAGDQTQLKYAGFAVVGLAVAVAAVFAFRAK